MSTSTISLNGIRLWAYHGCLPEERKIGTQYIINIAINVDTSAAEKSDCINDTVDYSVIYEIISKIFSEPVNLIEHLARKILNAIHDNFPQINNSTITIQKTNPPISGEIYSASFTLSYK